MDRDRLTDNQRPHYDAFMAAFRGIPTHIVCWALRPATGINWSKGSKDHMAYMYAEAKMPRVNQGVYPQMGRISLVRLREAALKEHNERIEWKAPRRK